MEEVSDIVVGVLVLVLGLIGLKMASGALDDEIYVFGLSMALFAALFEFGLIPPLLRPQGGSGARPGRRAWLTRRPRSLRPASSRRHASNTTRRSSRNS